MRETQTNEINQGGRRQHHRGLRGFLFICLGVLLTLAVGLVAYGVYDRTRPAPLSPIDLSNLNPEPVDAIVLEGDDLGEDDENLATQMSIFDEEENGQENEELEATQNQAQSFTIDIVPEVQPQFDPAFDQLAAGFRDMAQAAPHLAGYGQPAYSQCLDQALTNGGWGWPLLNAGCNVAGGRRPCIVWPLPIKRWGILPPLASNLMLWARESARLMMNWQPQPFPLARRPTVSRRACWPQLRLAQAGVMKPDR